MSEELESNKKSNGAFIAIIIILLLMLGGMAYMWSSKNGDLNTCSNDNKKLLKENKQMNAVFSKHVGTMSDNLANDMDMMFNDYEKLKESGTPEQIAKIEEQQSLILELKEQMRDGKMDAYRISKLTKENEGLRDIMRGYVYEIDSLNTLNLATMNKLDATSQELTVTKDDLTAETARANDLDDQVQLGKALQAAGITTVGLKRKLNNTMAEETKAKKVVQIRSKFTITANPIADAGAKMVYLQITGPSGKILQSSSSNVTQVGDGQVAYSDKKEIDYRKQSIDVAVFYSLRNQTLDKGTYKVKLFCQGRQIGTDVFTLK